MFHKMYTYPGETWAKTPPPHQNRIVSILKQQIVKQSIGEQKKNSEIVTILNQYKDNLDDFNDSSDPVSPD